jgi:hypothetical protein
VLSDRVSPDGRYFSTPFALPPDEMLRQDLTAPEKIYDSDGFKYRITPKARQHGMSKLQLTVSEKLGRSPDRGDALVYMYWGIFSPRPQLRFAS